MIQWIKDLRSTEKGKIAFKLSLYFLFFFIVLILCLVAGSMKAPSSGLKESTSTSNSREEEPTTLTYFDKQKRLVDGNYSFSYEIALKDKSVSFMGEKTGDVIEGFKEDKENLIHYRIVHNKTYKLELNKKEEIEDLYEGLNVTFFDYEKLFKTLNAMSATITREDDKKIYTYSQDDKNYHVYVKEKYIEKIVITTPQGEYKLEFVF